MPEQRYWDSTPFISWFTNDARSVACGDVLDACEMGDITLWTSSITLLECAAASGAMSDPDRLRFHDFFRKQYIKLVQVDRVVAEFAHEIMIGHGLTWQQSLHVASALKARAPLANTFDQALLGLSGAMASDPVLRFEPPRLTGGRQEALPID